MEQHFDILILGAGASGLTCALTASGGLSNSGTASPRTIAILDLNPAPGRKMRLAGGGMGNLTNLTLSPEHYVGRDPGFVRHALRKFPAKAAIALLDAFAFPHEERTCGQIFGLAPVSRLADAMADTCRRRGVRMFSRHRILALERTPKGFSVVCGTEAGTRVLTARAAVMALGSPAFPASGATDSAVRLASRLGHPCVPFRPVLTPLVLPADHPLRGLQGISAEVGLTVGRLSLRRPLLFTHRGISGPAGLVASCFGYEAAPLTVDMLPDERDPFRGNGRLTAKGLLRRRFPPRLADALLVMAALACPDLPTDRPLAEWGRRHLDTLSLTLHRCDLTPVRTGGMAPAEAAAGGLATDAFDPQTMKSRLVPNFFAAGECLDIAGILGGYNLHFAFASGFLAGRALA